MSGMDITTGRRIGDWEHILQSVRVILTTPVGTRVMRREFGSDVPALVDSPADKITQLELIRATTAAIHRWEPRVRVERVTATYPASGRVELAVQVRHVGTGEGRRLEVSA